MGFPISLFIALRYWRSKSADRFGRLVSNLASLGMVLGVMALIIVLSVMNGLEQYQKQQVLSHIPHAQIMPVQGTLNLAENPPHLPPYVQSAVAINTTQVIFQTSAGVSGGQVIGIQQLTDDPLLVDFVTQDVQQLLPTGEFKLIIGLSLAEKLQLKVGDKVRLMITENSRYTPFGRVPTQRLFTVSGIYDSGSEAAEYEVFANLTDIGRLMRIAPQQIQGYRLFLPDPFDITRLAQDFPPQQWKIMDWRVQKGEFFQAVRMEKNMMGLLIGLIIIVAISNIITSLSLMVLDKQGEIAILQTQGLNKRQIRHIFIWQGLLVGLMGNILGAILGVIATLNLDQIVRLINPQGIFLPTIIDASQIFTIIALSLLLALLSTIYPAYRASKIEPADALRHE